MTDNNKIAVITDGVDEKVLTEAENMWSYAGFTTIKSNLKEHEKSMAIVQVLRIIDFVAMKNSIEELKKNLNVDYSKLSTVSFAEVEKLINNISGDYSLIKEILDSNTYSNEVLNNLIKNVENLKYK